MYAIYTTWLCQVRPREKRTQPELKVILFVDVRIWSELGVSQQCKNNQADTSAVGTEPDNRWKMFVQTRPSPSGLGRLGSELHSDVSLANLGSSSAQTLFSDVIFWGSVLPLKCTLRVSHQRKTRSDPNINLLCLDMKWQCVTTVNVFLQ